MKEIIEEIVREEWRQFQLINSQGGRASCQDDWAQFSIMRSSQFLTWPEPLLASYARDLQQASLAGHNLIFNKYAYMMARTDPAAYERVKHVLPEISQERKDYLERAVQIHVRWAEDFARMFPKYAGKGRVIHQEDECCGLTSIETYQRGELYSYGPQTQLLYCEFVFRCEKEGKNLTYLVRDQMAKMYHYESVEDMERSQ